MTLAELQNAIPARYEATADHSFEEDRTVVVFSRRDNRKWFAAAKNIGRRYLGLDGAGRIDILNIRLDPRLVTSLRARAGFLPAWRMNQNNWVTVPLDGTVADEELFSLLDKAFAAAGIKGRRR